MASITLSYSAEDELRRLRPSERQEVDRALSFLEDDAFRDGNKIDLALDEGSLAVWALVIGRIWLAFVEEHDGSCTVVHLSLLSLFRPF